MDASKTDNGKTSGMILGIEKSRNFTTSIRSKSLPASSEINSHTVCSMNIKKRITNTVVNVIRNVFSKYLSKIFNLVINLIY